MATTSELPRNWEDQKVKLKQKFAVLVNNDLLFEEGKKEALLERLQIKLGKTKEEVQNIIELL
ncbi:CsbD family protein [Ancylomarina sp.]|uniref:CsbD family protein n=1 Tax=Ancylomarina sp. TaxID=1970196 RepID=UPI0035647DA3